MTSLIRETEFFLIECALVEPETESFDALLGHANTTLDVVSVLMRRQSSIAKGD